MAKSFVGTVSSDKASKTIVVVVQSRKTHPLYRKQYSVSKKFVVHDEKNEASVGDKVSFVESRPISATKHFKLVEIIERPKIQEKDLKTSDTEVNL